MKSALVFIDIFQEAAADFFTESAVLLFIFGFLEKIVSGNPITLAFGVSIIAIALITLVLGCAIRTWRKIWNSQSGS